MNLQNTINIHIEQITQNSMNSQTQICTLKINYLILRNKNLYTETQKNKDAHKTIVRTHGIKMVHLK